MQTGTNFSESFQTIYEDERPFLERTVNDYPASPFSLFLLLQHYKNEGDPRYNDLVKKAAVYFQNPAWLNYQLSGDELMKADLEEQSLEEEDVTTLSENEEERKVIDIEEDLLPENNSVRTTIPSSENLVEQEAIQEMETEEKVEFVQGEDIAGLEDVFVDKENHSAFEDTLLPENSFADAEESEKEAQAEAELDSEGKQTLESKHETNLPEETIPAIEAPLDSEETDNPVFANTGSEEFNLSDQEEKPGESPDLPTEAALPKEEESHDLEFEPLHTIDYFASQGIIIKEEALLDDKLGKQVKSFTDWLKSMKKLHPGKLPEQNEVVERIIQSSAELSNEDAGILTESMAEVLLKQGKKAKAIEMFEKLSLMNPSKSSYFAAKIESLKNK